MTDKEKYEMALESIQEILSSGEDFIKMSRLQLRLQGIFPELAESEDERIRKELIAYCQVNMGHTWHNINQEDYIAWLEKQGEPTEINPSEFDSQLNRLLKQFESLSKEELASSLSFYLNVVQNDGTYKSDKKQGEQKPAWSEEDGENSKNILYILNQLKGNAIYSEDKIAEKCIDWLKSIKDRVQPQPKQEWSEEDEKLINSIIELIDNGALDRDEKDYFIEKLKSLRPQNTWKPSDEQIKVCKEVYADLLSAKGFDLGTVNGELNRLEEELKKLK